MNTASLKILDHGHLILKNLPPNTTVAMLSEEPLGNALNKYEFFVKSFFKTANINFLEGQNKTHKFNERGHFRQDSDEHR